MNNINFFVYRLPYVVINFANIVVLSFVLHKHMHNNRPVMEVDLITFMSAAWVVRGNCLWKLGSSHMRHEMCACVYSSKRIDDDPLTYYRPSPLSSLSSFWPLR